MRFLIHLHSISCSALAAKDRTSYKPYVRFNFDSFRRSTRPLHFPSEHTRNDIVFPDSFSFAYETQYPAKLHQKQISIKAFSKNAILADDLIGQAHVDLHTIATGPDKQSLAITDSKGQLSGRISFTCEMEQVCHVSLHIKSISLSALPILGGKTPISHLLYTYSALEYKKRHKTEKQLNTIRPEWSGFSVLRFSGTLKELWKEGLAVDVMVKKSSRDKSHKLGSVIVRLCEHHSFKPQELLSVVERVVCTPEYEMGVQCVLRMHCYYEGLPSFVQMVKGVHDERGVHDAAPFADGLPLPRTNFFETKMPPQLPATGPKPAEATAAPVQIRVKDGEVKYRRRERSVMSVKAAREHDGASIMIRDYEWQDDEKEEQDEEDSRARSAPPPRPSSSMGHDSTTMASASSSAASSRGISRSSSSGNLSVPSVLVQGKPPATPPSQKRSLVSPPPPPPKPEPSSAVRLSLRALSISDPNNPFNGQERKEAAAAAQDSPSSSSLKRNSPHSLSFSPAQPPGKYGHCAVCGRAAGQMCPQVMAPVCSYPCKVKSLQAHGFSSGDDEKERPPPVNPEARQSPTSIAYPSLAASPVARQPGPAGFCIVCQYPAVFMCKDTLVPVCSAECKTVNLRLNPHLKGGGSAGRVIEPSAPIRQTLVVPTCVTCGEESEFKCRETGVDVCSRECKQVHLKKRQAQLMQLMAAAATTSSPPPPSTASSVQCGMCTYQNPSSASECEMCSAPLGQAPAPPSPTQPVYHLYSAPRRPSIPNRPSFAPVSPTAVRAAPGGPSSN